MVAIKQRRRTHLSQQLSERLLQAASWMEKKPFQDAELFQQAVERIAILESALREIYDYPGVLPNQILITVRSALDHKSSQ